MKKKFKAVMPLIILLAPFNLMAEQVRQAAMDGMVLNLGNYTQQVKVRAKALSTSDCKVNFTIQGKTVAVVAPAGKYSDWIGVGPTFLEPSDEKLGVSVKCDSGAITQVTYHK